MAPPFSPSPDIAPQSAIITERAVVRPAYAIIPGAAIKENVRSVMPGWQGTRAWILAAPGIGHAVGFAQYLVYLDPEGGCARPEPQAEVEGFLYVLQGEVSLSLEGREPRLGPGRFAFIPAGTAWQVFNRQAKEARFIWLRKRFEPLGDAKAASIIGDERELPRHTMPTSDAVSATCLIPTDDVAYDLNMNVVEFGPGTCISAVEAHVMEHGLYMLEGKGMYLLNETWHEVRAGDFIWMRAFCPQAYYAGGPGPTRYLLYKNVNRQVAL